VTDKICPKCAGKGFYAYDDNHSKPCEVCCPHDQGWWRLGKDYRDAGKWCCRRGCGLICDSPPATEGAREKERDDDM